MRIRKTPILNIKINVVDKNDSSMIDTFDVKSMNKMWSNAKKILSEDEGCSKTIFCYLNGELIKELTRKPLNEGKKFSWYIHNSVKSTNRRIQEKIKRLSGSKEANSAPLEIKLESNASNTPEQTVEKKAKILVG